MRAQAIIAMTPKGAEAEADKALRSGMPVAEFEGHIAAWSILDVPSRVEGREERRLRKLLGALGIVVL